MISKLPELEACLDKFWTSFGCSKIKACCKNIGAATFHPKVIKSIIKGLHFGFCFLQSTHRPCDSNYGLTHNLQKHSQYQVIMKPFYGLPRELFFQSIRSLHLSNVDNILFRKSRWESPTLNAWGMGWECIINSVEVCQITMFNQICGLKCKLPVLEITYGLERLLFASTGTWIVSYRSEILRSYVNNELFNCHNMLNAFKSIEGQLLKAIQLKCSFYFVYDMFLKMVEVYNVLLSKLLFNRILARFLLIRIQHSIKLLSSS